MKIQQGFSLLELMIAVAILGIISSIAIPSYTEYIRKGKRADAQTALMGLASVMERFYTENYTYCGANQGGVVGTCATGNPANFSNQVPTDGGTANYNLTISAAADATSYTLTATAVGSMAGDKCGNFTLTSAGVMDRTVVATPVGDCIRR